MSQGAYLFQGLSNAGDSIAQGLDRWKAIQNNAKVSDAMVKANSDGDQPLWKRMGFQTPEQYFSLSAPDRIAATTGYIKQQGVQEAIARMKEFQAQADARDQQVQDDRTAGQFLQNYLTAGTGTNDTTLTPDQRMAQAASKTPGMSGRILPKVMDSIAKWQQVTDANGHPVQPQETTVAGKKVIYNPRTGNFQTVDQDLQPQPVMDEAGNLYGHQVPNGKGGYKFVPAAKDASLKPSDALKAFNANSARIAQIKQQMKLAQNPDYKDAFDPEALSAELEALQGQQAELKSAWSPSAKTSPTIKTADGGTATPSPADVKYLQANPGAWQLFEKRFGKGSSSQFLP